MALGKSLGNILGDYFGEETVVLNGTPSITSTIAIDDIEISQHQTRSEFDQGKIQTLAKSIQTNGLIHPIVVLRKTVTTTGDKRYKLLAGERRLRATQALGEKAIVAIIRDESTLSDPQQALVTAMENLEREDLTPIELARTFNMLMSTQEIDEVGLSDVLHTSLQYVKNYLRLLTLEDTVQQALLKRVIGEGQARHLVGLPPEQQIEVLKQIINNDLTVKEIVALLKKPATANQSDKTSISSLHKIPTDVVSKAQKLAELFPKAKLKCVGDNTKGKIVIQWG